MRNVRGFIGMAFLCGAAALQAQEWKTSISLGLSATEGNSETMNLNGGVVTERKSDVDSWRIGVEGQYGEVGDSTTNEQAKGFANYKHTLSGRSYGVADVSLGYDAIADIDYRLIVSPGYGYYVLKHTNATVGLEIGPAYIAEEVGDEQDDYFALRLGDRYDQQLSATAKCWQSAEYLPSLEEFNDDYLLNAEVGVEAQINAKAAIRLVVKDAYDSTPAPDRKRNDLTVLGALAYTL